MGMGNADYRTEKEALLEPVSLTQMYENTIPIHLRYCQATATNSSETLPCHLSYPQQEMSSPTICLAAEQTATSSWHKFPDTAVGNTHPDVVSVQVAEKPRRPLTRRENH